MTILDGVFVRTLLFFVLFSLFSQAQAICQRKTNVSMDNSSSQLKFGGINLASAALQPVGTILGSTVATAGNAVGIDDETVLWTCDLADKDQLYEVFATNGDDRVGGFFDVGARDGMPGYYQTYFPYMALKITHARSGKVFTRYWQSAKLTNYDVQGKKILIKAKHLSPVQAELARVSTRNQIGSNSKCGTGMANDYGIQPWNYSCTQPNAYVALRGPGLNSDNDGEDSAYNYKFSSGVAYGMRNAASLSFLASCVVRNVTPSVYFIPITLQELQNDEKREADFSVQTECDYGVDSGTNKNQTAMGIQVSQSAFDTAQKLGLVTNGELRYMLSEGYGNNPDIATGIGIRIQDGNTAISFLGDPVETTPKAWFSVLKGSPPSGSYKTFISERHFTATLERLSNGIPVTPGKVYAIARVIVKVQ
ncbi:MAG: fimbrial protein [Herbaspirillum sp.]